MASIYVAVGLSIVFASFFAMLRFKEKEELSYIFKVLASAGFMVIAVLSFINSGNNKSYFIFVFCALSLGFLGDSALGLKNIIVAKKKYLVTFGIILFLLGHIVYSANFIYEAGINWWIFVVNLFIAIAMMELTKKLSYKLSFTFTLLGYMYSYTISLMLTSAVYYAISLGNSTLSVVILIGSISFYISDCLLSASYFKSNMRYIRQANLIVHITYYLAQILLALSCGLI